MRRIACCISAAILSFWATSAGAQIANFAPVTDEVLANPDPADWLMISRTFDQHRFSPLDQINKGNVAQLRMRDPETGWVNLGTYRTIAHDKHNAGVWISPGKHGRLIREKYFKQKQHCPVLICCGLDPVLFLAGSHGHRSRRCAAPRPRTARSCGRLTVSAGT